MYIGATYVISDHQQEYNHLGWDTIEIVDIRIHCVVEYDGCICGFGRFHCEDDESRHATIKRNEYVYICRVTSGSDRMDIVRLYDEDLEPIMYGCYNAI